MDQEGSSSFYVIDKQTSSHIVWRCTYKSCSGRLKICRKDNKVISSKPHNHDIEPRSKAASDEIESILCVKMNKYVVAAAVAIALLVGAIFGGVVGHYSTLYKLGYYEESSNNEELSSTMAMINGKSSLIDGRTNNDFNNQDLVNQEDVHQNDFSNDRVQQSNIFHDTHNENVFHENSGIADQDVPLDTFSDDLAHQDNRFPNTHTENDFQQNDRNAFESVNSNSNSFNPQLNLNNNPNVHNQGINHSINHPIQTSDVDQRTPNEFQQNTNTDTIQNQANQFLNHNRGNAGFHHNTHHSSNHRFQLNDSSQIQRDHNQHQQNIQRNVHLQRQQTQPLNQDHSHGHTNQNVHQRQHIHGHSLNHGANQQTNRNANLQNVNRQQFLPVNNDEMEIISSGPSFQSSFTLQSMSMIKEEDNIGVSTTTTFKTPTRTHDTGIPLDQSSPQRREQPSLANGFNPNLNQNQLEFFSEHPATDISNPKSDVVIQLPPGGPQSFSKVFSINVEGENVNEGFHIGKDLKPTMEHPSMSLMQDTTLSQNKEFNSHTDTALINFEGISMVTEGLSMAVLGLSLIDHNIDPQNINLKHKIDEMQDAISHINLFPSLNVSHRFSLGASSTPHNSEGISFGFAKSQATLPSSINDNTTPLEKKSLLGGKMPHQIMPTPISHSFQGSNINQPIPSQVSSPSIQRSNSNRLVPTPLSSQTLKSNSNPFFPNPVSHSVQRSNTKQHNPTPLFPNNQGSNQRQPVPTPLSPINQGSNQRQPVPTPLSPINQGSNQRQPVPTPLSPINQGSNQRQLVPTPLSPINQGSNPRQLVPTSLSPQIQGSNPRQLVPTSLSPQNQGSNPRQLVPTSLSPQIQGSNQRQLVPTSLSPQIQGSNPRQLVPTSLSPQIQGSSQRQFVPTSLSPQMHGSNTKQLIPTPFSPDIQVSNPKQFVPTPVSPKIQQSNININVSSPVSPPVGGLQKFVPTPISPKIGKSFQSNPTQDHQAPQQQSLISNTQENVRNKAVHGSHSKHQNWSNSGKLDMEEIKNYILKSVSTENLRNNLKELSRLPHQAGSARERQLANLIKERFLSSGFDMAELVPYDVLLSKPDPTQNNRVSLHTEGGVGEEVWAAQSVILPNEELQAYSAYSPSGKVMTSKGEAVVYVNYGQVEDFEYLDSIGVSLSGRVVMARTIIYVSGMKLVERAASRGARGVIVYSDPAEAVNPGDTSVYPNSTSLPGDAVHLKTIRSGQGDPLTPGWPSKKNSHRLLVENIKGFPSIPVQPISYNDAKVILQKLGGPASPIAWHGDLTDVSYNIGPTLTSDFAHLNLCLATYNQLKRTTIYNVIGTIKGEVEPDRYVILGNHRDAWAYGAIDPSSGTAQMLETAAVLGQLKAKGWRPRRTIVFASWGAEEFGKIGSTEWVEEHVSKLQERGVAYINVDICSTGPILAHAASPTLRDVLVDMAKLVPGMGSGGSVYDEWREYSLRVDKTEPKPWHLGTGTDFSAFSFFGGVPSMGMGFMRNSSENDVPMYPAYHTAIETFDLVDRFIDPGFTIHQGCSRLSSLTLVHLAESPVLPLDPHYLADTMEEALNEMKRKGLADVLMGTLGVQTLPALEESILSFKMAANAFQTRLRNPIYRKDPMMLRGINDQLTRLEQKFLMPEGSEEKPWCRQAVFAPSPGSPFGKWGFPALKDLLNDLVGLVNLHGVELSQRHHLIEKHVSDLILMTDSAISSLNHLHII